jgi:ornithine carbamoyltransferase
MGSDLRLGGPAELGPPDDVLAAAKEIAGDTGATITVTDDPERAVEGVDFVHTDVWVSMGEPKEVWDDRIALLEPYQVNTALMETAGNDAMFMHCLPAFHDDDTVVGKEMIEHTGMTDGIEVTNRVFEAPNSVVFDQAENRLHTIKAVLVATLA